MNTEIKNNHKYYNEGLMIIISSPSGAGKTTLCHKISLKDKKIKLSISYTTRKKRNLEIEGKHYKFIDKSKFIKLKRKNKFLESAEVFGNNYGTLLKDIHKKIKSQKDILFDIDWQGAKQIRKKFPNHIVDIFIMPPSIPELRRRLIKRGQDDSKIVQKRMKMAFNEMHHFNEYKYVIFNEKISKTLSKIMNIIFIERELRKNLRNTEKILRENKEKI